jgi:hypothetical protein
MATPDDAVTVERPAGVRGIVAVATCRPGGRAAVALRGVPTLAGSARYPDPAGAGAAIRAAGYLSRIARDSAVIARPGDAPRWVPVDPDALRGLGALGLSAEEMAAVLESSLAAAAEAQRQAAALLAARRQAAAAAGATPTARYVLNSAVLTAPGTYRYALLSVEEARAWLARGPVASRVGYPATLARIEAWFGLALPLSREAVAMQPGDEALVVRLAYRVADPAAKGALAPGPEDWEVGLLVRTG